MKTIMKLINDKFNYVKNNATKKQIIIFITGLLFIIVGFLSWNIYFSKYYIFKDEEKKLLETVKNYYFYHPEYLPKDGEIRTITLEKLYEDNRIEELDIPKTNKLCDLDSWVKVYNDNGNYIYRTYLKCGIYASNIDHISPTIILNGDDTIYVSLGHEYKELGVKEVKDNKDGKIDINKVVIDNSKVNTKKVGKYEVTYKIQDKSNNQTKIIRTVYVVRNLTDIVKDKTNESNYYTGQELNNYLLFSGMMYRIIRVNNDGTILIISDENLNNLRFDSKSYENSNVDTYLNKVYLNIIHNQSYLVDTEFCVGNIDSKNDTSKSCSKKIKRKIGILDINTLNNTVQDNNSYLISPFIYLLSNKENENNIGVTSTSTNFIDSYSNNILLSIRPVLTLKKDLEVMSGSGTKENPYKLNDYSYAKTHENVNSRLIGEYINYSGDIYRIMDIDKNENVKLVSIDGIIKKKVNISGNVFLTSKVTNNKKFVFNTKDENDVGYILNNNYIDYINDSHIIQTKYQIPKNIKSKKYSNYEKQNVTAKLVLAKTYDLFAGRHKSALGYLYLYLDESENTNNVFFMNTQNSIIYDDIKNEYGEYCLKIVLTVEGTLKIKSGKGTMNDPYYIR